MKFRNFKLKQLVTKGVEHKAKKVDLHVSLSDESLIGDIITCL